MIFARIRRWDSCWFPGSTKRSQTLSSDLVSTSPRRNVESGGASPFLGGRSHQGVIELMMYRPDAMQSEFLLISLRLAGFDSRYTTVLSKMMQNEAAQYIAY